MPRLSLFTQSPTRSFASRGLLFVSMCAMLTLWACADDPKTPPKPDTEVTDDNEQTEVDQEVTEPRCGDGVKQDNEECDEGANNSDELADACRSDCTNPICGDGVIDSGEQCDDGSSNSDVMPDACRSTCLPAGCGDGVVDPGEECDDGSANSDTAPGACRTSCVEARCGDGVVDTGEGCDQGANNSDTTPDACRSSCQEASCGDGIIDTGEGCDAGSNNSNTNPNACRLSCQPAGCGDGIIDDGELCDGSAVGSATCGNINLGFSGGTLSCNDTCEGYDTSECTETPASCGDGNLDAGEECDNGTANSDTTPNACRENCTLAGCGDNVVDDGEACDQGSANSDTTPNACRSTCELPTCGDAVQDTGEECDNGANNSNTVPNACRSTCRNPYCGDGVIDDLRTEECDGTNLDGETCFTQGATGGSISCTGLCILDVSNCLFIDPPEAAGDVVITELLQDPNSLVEADGEWFEVFNPSTTQSRNLDGCEIGHLESDVFVADDDIDTTLIIPPQGLLLFVRNGDSAVNGGLTGDFDYASSVSMNNTGTDSLVLSCGGTEIDRVVWSAAEVTAGRSWALSRDQHTAAANDNVDNWCLGSGTYGSSPNQGTPKDFNPTCPSCGDGTVSPGEDCDGGIGTNTCASIGGGFSGGSLSCDPVTCLWNTSACYGCGDGTVNPGEDCDGGIGTNTCASIGAGFSGGTLACNTTTCLWNTSGCTSPGCGNSVIDTGEQCDGSNLNSQSCTTVSGGFSGGTLACNTTSCQFDTSACYQCGDDTLNPGEVCDGTALDGESCATVGGTATSGNLACLGDCSDFDTSGCTVPSALSLYFSEYGEGTAASSSQKVVEIYNAGTASVDLSAEACVVLVYANGATTPNGTISLSGTVAADDVFVLCGVDDPIMCDQRSGSLSFNGDDAVELRCAHGTSTPVTYDVIGQIGFRPSGQWGTGLVSTADNTIRRKCSVTTGDTNGADVFDPAAQWLGFAADDFSDIGEHCVLNPVGWCTIQFPDTATLNTSNLTEEVYARVFVDGLTTANSGLPSTHADPHPELIGQLIWGPDATPYQDWTPIVTTANLGYTTTSPDFSANNDEYTGVLDVGSISPPDLYNYAFRFSSDSGETWRYCDTDSTTNGDTFSVSDCGIVEVE